MGRGQILRCYLLSGCQSNPVWGLAEPAYKVLEFHRAPGQTGTLNSHWLLEREAVADERSGSFGDDTLGYSSSRGGHWPLTWVRSRLEMLNFHWPSAHPGSLGQLSSAPNFDWLSCGSSFSSFSGTSWAVAGCKELPEIHW